MRNRKDELKMFGGLYQDLRFALRMLRKNPGFACVVIATLALGIGANAAIFSLTDKVLLQFLPVTNPDQLVVLSTKDQRSGTEASLSFSYPMYLDLRDKNQVFGGVIARGDAPMNISYGDQTERASAEIVSGNYFQVLGVRPWAGRLLTQDDDRTPGAHPVAVISYRFWERRFGKDPTIVGKTILANEYPLTVIGVTSPGFFGVNYYGAPDVWVPMMMTPVFNPLPPTRLQSRNHQWLTLMARRKDGISPEQAQASLSLLYQQIRESDAKKLNPSTSAFDREQFLSRRIVASPGGQGFQTLQLEMRTSLLVLFGATCVVLLILCGNLANLVMVRATVRAQEISVRLALGAGRLRLVRQWLTEGIVLALLGGAAGIVVAFWVKAALLLFVQPGLRANLETPMSWRFVGFVFLVSLAVGVAFSLAPAIQVARHASVPALQAESRSFTATSRLFSLRSGLILLQVALSLPLLITAVLLVRTLQNLRGLNTGFDKRNVLLATVNPSLNGYSPEKSKSFFDELLRRTRATPNVTAASLASDSPISGGWDQSGVVVEGYTPREGEDMGIDNTLISPDYFKVLQIPLLRGRDFDDHDVAGSQQVAIISEKMAQYFFGNTDPIGKRIGVEGVPDTTIVGVVKDAQYVTLRTDVRRHFYTPVMQQEKLHALVLQVKTSVEPKAAALQIQREIKQMDPHLPVYNVESLDDQIEGSLVQERLVTWLSISFGVLATLLAAVGLYGVLTFSVAQRTREIGIRVALGAQRRDVFKLIAVHGILLVGIGVVLGLAASVAAARLISTLLFGIAPTNVPTFAFVALGLLLVALLACYIPARRATKVDPLVALRYE
jgi:putative ABC transport system permease protein